jgi:4-hydroxybenzoate polyprenyltransferase
MYELLAVIFGVTVILSVYGMIKFGFNFIFLYILLFSLAITVWTCAAVVEERKAKKQNVAKN